MMANLKDYHKYIGNPDLPRSISTHPLWSHQEVMLNFSLSRNSLLYAQMSTGKTLVALRYLEQFPGLKIIISPAKPMGVYSEDLPKFYTTYPYDLYILDNTYGTAKDRLKFLKTLVNTNSVVVISYEIASRLPLHELSIQAVVADEAHRLGSWGGKQSRVLAVTCADIPHKICMTGTFFEDGYERLYGICRFLDPVIPKRGYPISRLFGHYNNFLDNFCHTYHHGRIRYITGYKNLGELANLIKSFTLRVRTEDVIDLPDLMIRSYSVILSDETREAYDQLRNDAIIELDDDAIIAPHILARMTRLQQLIASGELETEEGDKKSFDIQSRVDQLLSLMDQIGTEPVVVFTRFKRDIKHITENLSNTYSILDGSTNQVEDWIHGKTQVLIANIASGSEGLRLQRAHHTIIWSLGYSLKQYRQAIARLRRFGQKSKTVFVHTLLARGTIDQDIYAALERKLGDVLMIDKELDS